MVRHLYLKPNDLIIIGILIVVITDVTYSQENITTMDNTTCNDMLCSTQSFISTQTIEADKSCSDYSRGWGLQGSDWGCCGNYAGCCTYASLICYFHDAMCRCCDVGNNFCGPACKPEVDCFKEQGNSNNASQEYKYNTYVNDKNQTILSDFVNETAKAVNTGPHIPGEFLDIEEIEKTINNTENRNGYQFGLEVERLLNETENLLNLKDEIDDQGSGEESHQAVL